MTGWDILDRFITNFPPIAATILMVAAVVIFIIGFSRRGFNFVKYGFGKMALDESLEKRFDRLEVRLDGMDTRFDKMEARLDGMDARFDKMEARLDGMDARFDGIDSRFSGMDAKLIAIETNHFGHLKSFLTELTSILLDKGIINNSDKARLDNQLSGM